ncbi:cytochrome P450 [Mycena rosella]|uniref:Cytochrome P450 n=1 Tax=Mycena rosella TaxID=1033263 RepID=A0AAD7CVE7_MYCRO|nr:cytochrome P450 [Mycena rosella]
MFTPTILDSIVAATALSLYYHLYTRKATLPLPPGPKGWPLIGNVFDMPKSHSWKLFAQWGDVYGGIMSITLLGKPFVILNDPVIAAEILEKRGNLYADRPTLHMANMSGWERVLANARYGPQFKEYRKLIGRVIGTRESMIKFYPVEEYQANMFLKRVLGNPEGFDGEARKSTGAIVLHLTYGYKIQEQGNDPFIDLADKGIAEFSELIRPGVFLVDVMPILKYIPSWFPGAGFKRQAEMYTKSADEMAEVPLAYVKEQIATGQDTESYASNLLHDKDISDDRLSQIKWSAASFYGAGAETTVSVVIAYFLAAAKYPQVQAKAQAEMDAVVGRNRLPTFEDRDSLPYIEAVCKELFRWLPVVPLAIPHRAMADDVYEGYLIPKDTVVIPNVWKFLHDPKVYTDPFVFNPDRFMGPSPAPHPTELGVFGYGRRICPGIHLADVSVWICVAKAVAGLTITRAIDAAGNEIDPVAETTDGVVPRPIPFTCSVAPRTTQIIQLVLDATANAP